MAISAHLASASSYQKVTEFAGIHWHAEPWARFRCAQLWFAGAGHAVVIRQ
jgi:hypothetical protein